MSGILHSSSPIAPRLLPISYLFPCRSSFPLCILLIMRLIVLSFFVSGGYHNGHITAVVCPTESPVECFGEYYRTKCKFFYRKLVYRRKCQKGKSKKRCFLKNRTYTRGVSSVRTTLTILTTSLAGVTESRQISSIPPRCPSEKA